MQCAVKSLYGGNGFEFVKMGVFGWVSQNFKILIFMMTDLKRLRTEHFGHSAHRCEAPAVEHQMRVKEAELDKIGP